MNIVKDKVYTYYHIFKKGFSVEEIYGQYRQNKKRCGGKEVTLSMHKVKAIRDLLDQGWSLDAILTLVEKRSKYIVLLKASHKSQDVKDAPLN